MPWIVYKYCIFKEAFVLCFWCRFVDFLTVFCGIITIIVVSLATEKKFYEKHSAQTDIFKDFFIRGRVSAWIRENM